MPPTILLEENPASPTFRPSASRKWLWQVGLLFSLLPLGRWSRTAVPPAVATGPARAGLGRHRWFRFRLRCWPPGPKSCPCGPPTTRRRCARHIHLLDYNPFAGLADRAASTRGHLPLLGGQPAARSIILPSWLPLLPLPDALSPIYVLPSPYRTRRALLLLLLLLGFAPGCACRRLLLGGRYRPVERPEPLGHQKRRQRHPRPGAPKHRQRLF